jgi:hypothetical protein
MHVHSLLWTTRSSAATRCHHHSTRCSCGQAQRTEPCQAALFAFRGGMSEPVVPPPPSDCGLHTIPYPPDGTENCMLAGRPELCSLEERLALRPSDIMMRSPSHHESRLLHLLFYQMFSYMQADARLGHLRPLKLPPSCLPRPTRCTCLPRSPSCRQAASSISVAESSVHAARWPDGRGFIVHRLNTYNTLPVSSDSVQPCSTLHGKRLLFVFSRILRSQGLDRLWSAGRRSCSCGMHRQYQWQRCRKAGLDASLVFRMRTGMDGFVRSVRCHAA